MLIMEAIVASACFAGNSVACDNSEQAYVKYNKLDTIAQEMGDRVKKRYPTLYYMGMVGGSITQKHYNTMIYGGFGAEINFANSQDERGVIYYKYSF